MSDRSLRRPQHFWLRLEALTPAHLGTESLSSDLESPTQVEPFHGLPYLPDSALKGVLAGSHGNLDDSNPGRTRRRARLYGEPDRFDPNSSEPSWGRPGPVVLGNGDLLAFPVLVSGGGRAWAIPALHLARFLSFDRGGTRTQSGSLFELLAAIETSPAAALAWRGTQPCALPRLAAGAILDPAGPGSRAAALPGLGRTFEILSGGHLPAREPRLLMSAAAARRLWILGADRRTLTALNGATKTVEAGALRRLELIPAGSLFLSRVTLTRPVPGLSLPDTLQLGSGEGVGLGTLRLAQVDVLPEETAEETLPSKPPKPLALADTPENTPQHALMLDAQKRTRAVAATGENRVLKATRAAIMNLGPRLHFSGLSGAVAFSLAKARATVTDPSPEQRAHRVLAAAILDLNKDQAVAVGPFPALTAKLEDGFPQPDAETLSLQALWLRRYAELGLRPRIAEEP